MGIFIIRAYTWLIHECNMNFKGEIMSFLSENGIICECRGDVLLCRVRSAGISGNYERAGISGENDVVAGGARELFLEIVPVSLSACGTCDSVIQIQVHSAGRILLYEDYWRRAGDNARKRLLAHLGKFRSVFARKCRVERIAPAESSDFMNRFHSYGAASAAYHYALYYGEEMVAVATFSSGRKIKRVFVNGNLDTKQVEMRSHEWIRYVSLPDVRVAGGMGRLLKAFINDVNPDDVMSYADLEWSDGDVYRKLDFIETGSLPPVEFYVDPVTCARISRKKVDENQKKIRNLYDRDSVSEYLRIKNPGSRKYLWINPMYLQDGYRLLIL